MLYEGGTVPVRALAKLMGVSVRTLYHHAHKRGWTMRNAAPVKGGARRKDRLRAQRNALLPKAPRGLLSRGTSARDPQMQAAALGRAQRAQALADAAHAQALARRERNDAVRAFAAEVSALAALERLRRPGGTRPARKRTVAPSDRYDPSPEQIRAELLRRMSAIAAEAERAKPAPPVRPGVSPAAAQPSPPEPPSAHARRTERIIERLQGLRRRPC